MKMTDKKKKKKKKYIRWQVKNTKKNVEDKVRK